MLFFKLSTFTSLLPPCISAIFCKRQQKTVKQPKITTKTQSITYFSVIFRIILHFALMYLSAQFFNRLIFIQPSISLTFPAAVQAYQEPWLPLKCFLLANGKMIEMKFLPVMVNYCSPLSIQRIRTCDHAQFSNKSLCG